MSFPAAQAVAPTGAQPSSGSATTAVSATATYATFVAPDTNQIKQHSPLLLQTPPTVTRALSLSYRYILAADRAAALLTWTSGDVWSSFLLVCVWAGLVLHWETLIRYAGHLLAVGAVAGYVHIHSKVDKEQQEHPTLDAIIHTLTTLTTRLDMFFSPVTSLSLTNRDLTRLLATTLFLSPVYIFIAFYILTPRLILLSFGSFVLTYHSLPARVSRTILWRSRTARLLSFYLTGIDFSKRKRSVSLDHAVAASAHRVQSGVRFTYVVYENQRKWLGIGWTANLLAYERTAWADEFLNECLGLDEFTLPDAEGTGMRWKWVDTQWRVDRSNGDDDGWIYYDNTWKKGSKEDVFGKYTRRRRWVRNAELVEDEETMLRHAKKGSDASSVASSGNVPPPQEVE
ncbi:integral peroxisomal membrane peroxin-domain-containing protein [Lipomyces japonicus]|uniref:integral peroxisomal membrane peroxin-domain-containing protein n=1 Tax=Lipomyces japonicus TaxID=56871 RepID=UPI0034CF3D1D